MLSIVETLGSVFIKEFVHCPLSDVKVIDLSISSDKEIKHKNQQITISTRSVIRIVYLNRGFYGMFVTEDLSV